MKKNRQIKFSWCPVCMVHTYHQKEKEAWACRNKEHQAYLTIFTLLNFNRDTINPSFVAGTDLSRGGGFAIPAVEFVMGDSWRFKVEADLWWNDGDMKKVCGSASDDFGGCDPGVGDPLLGKRENSAGFMDWFGKPIIEYIIKTLLKMNFDRIILSTDDEKMGKKLSKKFNKLEFIKRSEKASDDSAIILDVCYEVLGDIREGELCIIYPTAVFTTVKNIQDAQNVLHKGYDTVFPVIEDNYYAEKALDVFEESVSYKYPQFNHTPSQACKKLYHHAGQEISC